MSSLVSRLGEAFFRGAPTTPGVYLMFGDDDELLYVGKAKNLRARLRNYARAEEGTKLDRLTSAVRTIRWEQYRTEADALARETDLLRGVRPPFNSSLTDRSEYLFITITDVAPGRVRFNMSPTPVGTQVYGCFPYTARAPDVFPAFLRLVSLAQGRHGPSRIPRTTGFVTPLDDELRVSVHRFLSGQSPRLIDLVDERLAKNDEFMRRSARDDRAAVRKFYRDGPRATRRLRLRHKLPPGPVSVERMNELVAEDLRAATGTPVRTRDEVEARILALAAAGKSLRSIAGTLNAERIPRFGDRRGWAIWHVRNVISKGGWRAKP